MADFSSLALSQSSLAQYEHVIPALEAAGLIPTDLLSRDARSVATRAKVPVLDIARLQRDVAQTLRTELLGASREPEAARHEGESEQGKLGTEAQMISTLDTQLDAMLGGGLPVGYVTEVVGESGVGKTQFLLCLLLAAQLPPPHGLDRPTIYISTEHALPTQRLDQLLRHNPTLTSAIAFSTNANPATSVPSLGRVFTLHIPDLETQEHILAYQLPVACSAHKPGLIVLDSIAANYRDAPGGASGLAARAATLYRTGALLRQLAREHDCAIVVSNHVADRIPAPSTNGSHAQAQAPVSSGTVLSSPVSSSAPGPDESRSHPMLSSPLTPPRLGLDSVTNLTLDHQQRFFTGWGANPAASEDAAAKTPALGLVWANQIAARIAIVKEATWGESQGLEAAEGQSQLAAAHRQADPRFDPRHTPPEGNGWSAEWTPRHWRRWMRLVFAAWTGSTLAEERGIEVEIWAGGLRAVAGPRHGPSGNQWSHYDG